MSGSTSEAGSTYEVLAIRYGTRVTKRSHVFLNYHIYGEEDGPIRMDYYFWIARNHQRTVVVDCGFGRAAGLRRGREVLCTAIEAMRRAGVEPEGIEQFVATHAHYDHIGNLGQVERAEIIVSRRELEFWMGPHARRQQFASSAEPAEIEQLRLAQQNGRVTAIANRHVVAPGIEVVEVGGHTPGQLVVLVKTATGCSVLTSDAVHYYEEYERDRPFTFAVDVEKMYSAFDLLREITSEPGYVMVPGHDPDVMTRFPPFDGLEGMAVRVG